MYFMSLKLNDLDVKSTLSLVVGKKTCYILPAFVADRVKWFLFFPYKI